MESFGERMVMKGSLKLRIMGSIMQESTNEDWIKTKCQEHESEMIDILKAACIKLDLYTEDE